VTHGHCAAVDYYKRDFLSRTASPPFRQYQIIRGHSPQSDTVTQPKTARNITTVSPAGRSEHNKNQRNICAIFTQNIQSVGQYNTTATPPNLN